MPSTINAQTTPFAAVVTTADDTGNLALQTANVTALTINSSQVVSLAQPLPVSSGGTGSTSNATAPFALKGANTDITSLGGLTTALSVAQGGTGSTSASGARTNLGVVIGTDVLAPTGTGTGLTALNASNVTSGTIATARLASGTANSSTYLRGDQTWAAINASPAGLILQVQQTYSSTNQSFSGGSWYDITGLSVTITPSATANKILVLAQFNGTVSDNTANTFRLLRNGSEIYGSSGTNGGFRTWGNASYMRPSITGASFNIYDSPSSTSALTYKIQGYASNTWYINQNYGGETLSGYRGTVSIIAMEIKG
jgi:hypothetical protein